MWPAPATELIVKPEKNNPYDPKAMIVKMPSLGNISADKHDLVTRPGNGERERVARLWARSQQIYLQHFLAFLKKFPAARVTAILEKFYKNMAIFYVPAQYRGEEASK